MDYTITTIDGKLYHHGIKGQKWGVRKYQYADGSLTPAGKKKYGNKVEKKYAKAGRLQGTSDYYKSEGDSIKKNHDNKALALEKQANVYEMNDKFLRAEAARTAANSIRKRGENASKESYELAKIYAKRAERANQKASEFASRKKVDLGKEKIDSILKESKNKGYAIASFNAEVDRENDILEKYGDTGLDIYKKIQAK